MDTKQRKKATLVSIIMPCFNEETYIRKSLDSLLSQKLNGYKCEILIADGMSTDRTRSILHEYAQHHSEIKILDNHERVTPAALKILLDNATGEYVVRVDGHSVYPKEYVATLAGCLAETGAANVGGAWETVPANGTIVSRIIANALTSRFGVGSSYRTQKGRKAIEVDTVPFGAWRRDHFDEYGGFDPQFIRAQDLEHNIRIKTMGGKILCLPWLRIRYYARGSFSELMKMAFQYGYWKVPVTLKYKRWFSVRQYLPPLLVLGMIMSVSLSTIYSPLLFVPLFYFLLSMAVSIRKASRDSQILRFPLYMCCFFIMHFCYGLGYWRACLDAVFSKSSNLLLGRKNAPAWCNPIRSD